MTLASAEPKPSLLFTKFTAATSGAISFSNAAVAPPTTLSARPGMALLGLSLVCR